MAVARDCFVFRGEPDAGAGACAACSAAKQAQEPAKAAGEGAEARKRNPFAPEPAPPLPPGMTGSDANDPRAKLTPGLYDAGEASMGIKHLLLLKKPDAFQLGATDPDDPKVQKTMGQLGVGESGEDAEGAEAGDRAAGFRELGLCVPGQSPVPGEFLWREYLRHLQSGEHDVADFDGVPGRAGRCVGVQEPAVHVGGDAEWTPGLRRAGISAGASAARQGKKRSARLPAAQKDRFRGVRIFDISDIKNPKQVAAVQTCRGSHTHTLVVDPNDKDNVYIYVSGTSFVRQPEELAGCSGEKPDKDPNTALFRIDVIKVPVAAPQDAKIVSSPRVFIDARTGAMNGLSNGGSHGKGEEKPEDTDQCHDITVYSAIGLAAGACSGNGILLDIKDPVHPKRVDAVNDPNYSYWHSASFSNDGTKVVFTDEWGGGLGARCRPNDPNKWGADAIFQLKDDKLSIANYYKLPAAQGDTENCVAHNGSLIPVPGRDIEVQAWYQGGISVMDFTDAAHPFEIAYFDRGPIDPKMLVLGGDWSAYWYNGNIYGSEIARGLDVFELTPTKFLTQNEIDAAKAVRVAS